MLSKKPPAGAQPVRIENPLVVMFQAPDGSVICHIDPSHYTHQHYGLLICDLVRHVAAAYKVSEDAVWEWVDKEREHHTTDITRPQ